MDDPLSLAFWKTLGMTVLCGGIVGLERQISGKAAGLRTCILICLGTALFVQLGRAFAAATPGVEADPTRVLGQIITGVGFIGAGVIWNRGELVHGVTTAATIWVVTGIGAAIALGLYAEAFAVSIFTVVVLVVLEWVELFTPALQRGHYARTEPDPRASGVRDRERATDAPK